MRQLKAQKLDSNLGQREVDVYAGLNIMILLLELHRYAIDNSLEEEIAFYPCGKPDENGKVKNPDRFLKIIHCSSCIRVDSFKEIVGEFLSFINLNGANLNNANLHGTNLYRANLNNANLNGANLNGANLNDANLNDANFNGTNFNGTNFNGTNFNGTNLYRANLYCANLNNAYLSGAIDLTPEQIKSAKDWEKAKYSPEFREKLGLPPE